MADTNFDPTYDLLAPQTASAESLIYSLGTSVAGDVYGGVGALAIDEAGKLVSPTGVMTLNRVVEHTSNGYEQIVNATTALTQIDLNLGADIILNQSSSTIVRIVPPAYGCRMFGIERRHANNTNVYSLEFLTNQPNAQWYKEGGLSLTLTQTANSVDYIIGFIDSLGRTVTFMPRLNGSTPTPFATSVPFYIPNKQRRRISSRISGVQTGAIFSTMENGTINATTVLYDGRYTFTSPIHMKNLLAKNRNMIQTARVAEPTFNIDLEAESMIVLDHSSDITTISLNASDPDELNFCAIYRIKDASSTPRAFAVDPTLFIYEVKPIFCQSSNCFDVIFIQSNGGMNSISVFNDFF